MPRAKGIATSRCEETVNHHKQDASRRKALRKSFKTAVLHFTVPTPPFSLTTNIPQGLQMPMPESGYSLTSTLNVSPAVTETSSDSQKECTNSYTPKELLAFRALVWKNLLESAHDVVNALAKFTLEPISATNRVRCRHLSPAFLSS